MCKLRRAGAKPAFFLARRSQCLQGFSHDPAVLGSEIMFPDTMDAPTKLAKLAVHAAITSLVGGDFLFPIGPVAGRGFAMFRAAVPETPINKNSQAKFWKHKIRPPEQWFISPPTGDTMFSHD